MLKDSIVKTLAQQINKSRGSVEATMTKMSAEITSALSTHTRQQMMVFASILNGYSEGQRQICLETESSKLPTLEPPHPRSKKKRRKRDQHSFEQKVSSYNYSPNMHRIIHFPSHRYDLYKESEASIVHKRSCPMWYHSQIITNYGLNIVFLQRLRISGSLSVNRSPYASIPGVGISQNLTYRAVVPDDAPAFKVLRNYLRTPGFGGSERCITSCVQDLRAVFQSGYGLPSDTLKDGTTLIKVS